MHKYWCTKKGFHDGAFLFDKTYDFYHSTTYPGFPFVTKDEHGCTHYLSKGVVREWFSPTVEVPRVKWPYAISPTRTCELCDGPLAHIGRIGHRFHYRCLDCLAGWSYVSWDARPEQLDSASPADAIYADAIEKGAS